MDDHVVVTPTGAVLAELRPELTTVVDMEGNLVEGDLGHLGAVPPPGASTSASTRAPSSHAFPRGHRAELRGRGGAAGPLPDARLRRGGPRGPVRDLRHARARNNVHAALEGRSAALMQNHGAVCFAGDCHAATELALLLEWACEVYWRASAIGDPRVLSEDELAGVVRAVSERGYGQFPPRGRARPPAPGLRFEPDAGHRRGLLPGADRAIRGGPGAAGRPLLPRSARAGARSRTPTTGRRSSETATGSCTPRRSGG